MDAHYMKPDHDCMGNPTPGYWRCFATCSDGRCVAGTGATEGEALTVAAERQREHEAFLALPPIDKLKQILARGEISGEAQGAIQIIGQLVVDLCEKDYAQHG
jgi:hypothetical protein